jgi:hypothetical protein
MREFRNSRTTSFGAVSNRPVRACPRQRREINHELAGVIRQMVVIDAQVQRPRRGRGKAALIADPNAALSPTRPMRAPARELGSGELAAYRPFTAPAVRAMSAGSLLSRTSPDERISIRCPCVTITPVGTQSLVAGTRICPVPPCKLPLVTLLPRVGLAK